MGGAQLGNYDGPLTELRSVGQPRKLILPDCPPHDMFFSQSLTVLRELVQRGREDLAFHLADHSGAARTLADASEVRSSGVNERSKYGDATHPESRLA